ncbi:Zinc finger, RING/FYVE/PHD-type [Artemisia annua]|uniref:E3 ubiquitin-protein ligase RMA n=1 Tax=Artemisia annua TaxID=35608 RepID=A0A2U1Q570_ARTAN|nr:Zinc finger, RING/FYVE/PHD-type [Artemisia annua]
MGDESRENVMNLDLNLGPVESEPRGLNLEDWLGGPVRDSIGQRSLARQRWRSIWRPVLFPAENENGLETGEGSVAVTPPEVIKTCDNYVEDDVVGDKEEVVKSNGNEGGFFDCNICLDMASEPVVTCCGHLFCWPCLYRWLHIHSDVKECPICKGEMTTKSVTPIYGRGNPSRVVEEDLSLKIPNRPQAKRVESWRQTIQRTTFTMPMEEMIRRLGSRFDLTRDLTRDLVQGNSLENPREINTLLNRYLSSRGLRMDQNQEQNPSTEDRDSVSSIAAVIQSDSQTVDTAVEIDSRVSLSTSSSRRRSDSSRVVSDVDSGDSRAPRRRRLH